MMRILLVEDDHSLGQGIRAGLRYEGYAIDWVRDGLAASQALETENYDLTILDIGLPKCSGLEVLGRMRSANNHMPVLILTAKDTINDKVAGLDHGADDYMIKPFDLDELCARIRALLRRNMGRTSPILRHGNIEMNPASHSLRKNDKLIDLPSRSYMILQILMENAGRVMSKSRLEEHIYSWKEGIESNALEVHIHRIRKKIGNDAIRTIRGVGYILN